MNLVVHRHLVELGGAMLVLSRKVGERICIGNQVTVTVVRISSGGVRLGIEAPADLAVVREELIHANEGDFVAEAKPPESE